MKRVTKLMLMLTLAGPSVIHMSCSNMFWRSLRDAAVDGVADFVQGATFDALDSNLSLLGE